MMKSDVKVFNSIREYNDFYGFETIHEQIALVDIDKFTRLADHSVNWGLYAVFLMISSKGIAHYGDSRYSFVPESVISFAPGQVVSFRQMADAGCRAIGIVFHPDLLCRTGLDQKMGSYRFFSYESNEGLQLNEEECNLFYSVFSRLRKELGRPSDEFTNGIVVSYIQIVLDHMMRCFNRQFSDFKDGRTLSILSRFEGEMEEYLRSGAVKEHGVPSVKYFADRIGLSPNYFGELVKRRTGKTAQDYIQLKTLNYAKDLLFNTNMSISEVAYAIGFPYPQHFSRFFKRMTGQSPMQFKKKH